MPRSGPGAADGENADAVFWPGTVWCRLHLLARRRYDPLWCIDARSEALMLPRVLTPTDPEHERARYKIVRRDNFQEVPGLILSANVETGLCLLRDKQGDSKEYNFGPDGICIVTAAR
jgi:hypothetical protein